MDAQSRDAPLRQVRVHPGMIFFVGGQSPPRLSRFFCGGTKSPHAPRIAKGLCGDAARPFRNSWACEAWCVVFVLGFLWVLVMAFCFL